MKTLNKINFAKCLSLLFLLVLTLPPPSLASHNYVPPVVHDPHQFIKPLQKKSVYKIPKAVDGRKDLTDIPFITIDPKQAHELDDAAFVKANEDGTYTCQVAIADPVCFMEDSSVIKKAIDQVFTLYEEDPVKPLFPSELTAVTSITPNKVCPTVVVEFVVGKTGEIEGTPDIYQGLMSSRAKLNYEQVNAREMSETITPLVDNILKAATLLKSQRDKMDSNWISSEQAVAEMMITANGIVADYIKEKGLHGPYRTQSAPGERAFYTQKPQKHASLSNMLYTHFTSPLRRLPDCLVHAALFYPKLWAQIEELYGVKGKTASALTMVLAQVNKVDNRLKDEARDKKKVAKKRKTKHSRKVSEGDWSIGQYYRGSKVLINHDPMSISSGDTDYFDDHQSSGSLSFNSSDAETDSYDEEDDLALKKLLRKQKRKAKKERRKEKKAKKRNEATSSEAYDATLRKAKLTRKRERVLGQIDELKEQLRLLEEELKKVQ